MSKNLLLLFFFFGVRFAFSQDGVISGRVIDSASGKGLAYATVSLVKAADSVLVVFAVADSSGAFRLSRASGGPFLLSLSYAGYVPLWTPVPAFSGLYAAGTIRLVPVGMQDVNVIARRPPVEMNNDTLEFNSENFKTQPNAVVEDLLRKMPGVTIESDGTVKVNGQTVRRVLVNGKEFFTGDVKMATKNLNADAVDKVQVYDRKSDQASFTGVDDGNSEKTINLQLKKNRNNALFGKVTASGGSGASDAQTNINHFKGDEQVSLLAMGNNTNRQGFSFMDVLNFTGALAQGMRNGGGGIHIQAGDPGNNDGLPVTGLGQDQQGVATTIAGGLNYNNTWDRGRTSLNTNYTMSHIRLLTDKESATQNLLPGNTYTTLDSAHTVHSVTQERLNVILDQQLDSSFSFRLTPSLTVQHTNKNALSSYLSSLPDGTLLNNGYNNVQTLPAAVNVTSDALIRKKLAKKGRTVSGDFNITYNHSTSTGNQLSDNRFYESGGTADSAINQYATRDAVTRSVGGNITYTEPIGRRSLMAFSGFYNSNTGSSTRQTFDFDPGTGKHDHRDTVLSNDFSSDYRYSGGGLSFRSNQGKLTLTAGATVQAAMLSAMDNSNGKTIRQSFTDVLPNAVLQYAFTRAKNLRLDYSTYTTQPSVIQLQPVADLSDPLNIRTGNPGLKRTYRHQASIAFLAASPGRRTNLMTMVSYTASANAIVESDSVSPAGAKVITPVNTDGVRNLVADVNLGFPLRKLSSRLEIGSYFSYGQNISFLNGARNRITSTTVGPRFSFSFNRDDRLDVELTASISLNTGEYSLQPALNTNYMRQNYGVNSTWYLPWRLSLHNEFNILFNTGRTNGYNTTTPLWNASLAKNVLRNDRGEIKFSIMDLLDRNTGISRSINQGSIVDEQYNVLRRYFLLGFTYSLNKAGLRTKGGPKIDVRRIGQ
ncbi:TonB-dependent receptor [Puia dinghuensis]|uniref:Outer membrane protein beta-barrel domain-containing protein n=1 Tax=Puia dinghuensis TaxID=1792502 RepID=A0A8J2UDS5_9BACT|nr:TonB-dependent receptor [Puia dinghuensis]GGB03728.1 hypothetical protein GCM10011511_28790 [Puia dinghuensis]